jgi:hypothetical protein
MHLLKLLISICRAGCLKVLMTHLLVLVQETPTKALQPMSCEQQWQLLEVAINVALPTSKQ